MSTTKQTRQHEKQVIGYITQYDVWKGFNPDPLVPTWPGYDNLVRQGSYNQLNVDFSQYTILNFSFFGLAKDGTLHSADHRNKNIYLPGTVQDPDVLIWVHPTNSWDQYILYGSYPPPNLPTNPPFPAFPLTGAGADGLVASARAKGVKVMASLGGWSMSKHFWEVAADPGMRRILVGECVKLIDLGFDGIDFDWEYPGAGGMNIVHPEGTEVDDDYPNFATLMREVRDAIGDKLITAAMSADPKFLEKFDWVDLQGSMNFFNIMTYDINGGWSDRAGHNSPLYNYEGEEQAISLDSTTRFLLDKNVAPHKINLGVAFYGRGVKTKDSAALNALTADKVDTVPHPDQDGGVFQPDGPIPSCGDFDNWARWDATPFYSAIMLETGGGGVGVNDWKYHFDTQAMVPYLTKGNYFLSYDNERSIRAKANYVAEKGLAGVIVWNVFGEMQHMTDEIVARGPKLQYCPKRTSPLSNVINETFADYERVMRRK